MNDEINLEELENIPQPGTIERVCMFANKRLTRWGRMPISVQECEDIYKKLKYVYNNYLMMDWLELDPIDHEDMAIAMEVVRYIMDDGFCIDDEYNSTLPDETLVKIMQSNGRIGSYMFVKKGVQKNG